MKRVYLLLLIFFCTRLCWAQSWKELNDSAKIYYIKGEYQLALDFAQKELEMAEKESAKPDSNYATSLNRFGEIYFDMGNFDSAGVMFKQALEIRKTVLGEQHPEYANSLDNLAIVYATMSNYLTSESLFKQALNIRKKTLGEEHPDYAASLNNLAHIYMDISNYSAAEPLYKQALAIRKKNQTSFPLDYSESLDDLAQLYISTGNYSTAELMKKQAIEIRKKVLGDNHIDYALSLTGLADLYNDMGNYTAAISLYKQTLQIYKNAIGVENSNYAGNLDYLAMVYDEIGNHIEAESLFKQAIEIRKKTLGEDHPTYAASLNNLAVSYISVGKYVDAEPLLKKSSEIVEKGFGKDHPDYAEGLNNLANLYVLMGNYTEAEALYDESLRIRKKVFGEEHPLYATSLSGLAHLYELIGRYTDAEILLRKSVDINKKQIFEQLTFMSESEEEKYVSIINNSFEDFQSFLILRSSGNTNIVTDINDLLLFVKGIQLQSAIATRENILQSGDTSLINIFNQWSGTKHILAKLYSLPIENRYTDVSVLEQQAEELEKQLTRNSQLFKQQKENIQIKTTSLQSKLQSNEAAIEFTSFNYYSRGKQTDSVMYAALILRRDRNQPALIPLFEEKQLNSLFSASASVNNLYASRGLSTGDSIVSYGTDLYNLIWSKIEPELKGIKTVYYSPSGQLNRIAFAALPVDAKQLLSDKYSLVLVSSTAEIVNKAADNVVLDSHSTVALFGGINYNASVSEMQTAIRKNVVDSTGVIFAYNSVPPSIRRDIGRGNDWTYLPGSLKEVNQIAGNLRAKSVNVITYTGSSATEDVLRNLQAKNAPTVLHISTHGFFFPEEQSEKSRQSTQVNREEIARTSENPLLRSGLIFAGGNNKWKNDTLQLPDGLDDGIVTAYDVSNMDLSDTRLAVLSACQTGLGDIKGSEGVYGMQRAFKMAGVDYLIVSLWSVYDESSQEFMTEFYDRWIRNKDIEEAFKETQQAIRKKYKDPFDWAGFVLMK